MQPQAATQERLARYRWPGRAEVRPRYTPGSPAMVDGKTAEHVARGEQELYQGHLEGYFGEENQARAQRLGLQRIVYQLTERGGHWVALYDWLTEEVVEGRQAVELELAAIGTRPVPRDREEAMVRFGLWQHFRKADLVERRDMLARCLEPRWCSEYALGFRVQHGAGVGA